MFVVITVFMMMIIAMELVPTIMASVFLPALYVLSGIADAPTVFSGWTQPIPFMLVGAFVLALGLKECGLLDRIAYGILAKTGGTYKGILLGIAAASIILSFLTSANADAIMVAFTFGICVALNLGCSKASSGIMMVGAIVCADVCLAVFKPANMSITLANAKVALGESFDIGWSEFLVHNWPWLIAVILFVLGLCKFWKPDVPFSGREYFQDEYQKLGKMTMQEKKGLVIALIILVLLLTAQVTGLNSQWILALVPWIMFLPGVNVATEKSLKDVKFPVVFFAVACISIGSVAAAIGIGGFVANALTPILNGIHNNFLLAGIVFVISTILNFFMTPFAMIGVAITPICTILNELGLSPYVGLYAFGLGVETVFLPYESVAFLLFYAFGSIRLRDFVKICAWKALFLGVWLLLVMVPYWNLIGIG